MKINFQKILKTLKTGLNPVFIVFLFAALVMWFLNELSHTYSTVAVIPVKVVNAIDSRVGIMGGDYQIECRIEGEGYRLLGYKWFPKEHLQKININRLNIVTVDGSDRQEITVASMLAALSGQINDVRVQSIVTPRLDIITSPVNTKKVPVISCLEVEYNKRYMQVGSVRIDPDSVEVRSLDVLLDTLKGVYTEAKTLRNVSRSISGDIPLIQIPDVILSPAGVAYTISVEEFTEEEKTAAIEILNAPQELKPIIIPEIAVVKMNVSSRRYADKTFGDLKVYIDYNDRATNIDSGRYKVRTSAEEGITVKSVDPLYVELLFEKP